MTPSPQRVFSTKPEMILCLVRLTIRRDRPDGRQCRGPFTTVVTAVEEAASARSTPRSTGRSPGCSQRSVRTSVRTGNPCADCQPTLENLNLCRLPAAPSRLPSRRFERNQASVSSMGLWNFVCSLPAGMPVIPSRLPAAIQSRLHWNQCITTVIPCRLHAHTKQL